MIDTILAVKFEAIQLEHTSMKWYHADLVSHDNGDEDKRWTAPARRVQQVQRVTYRSRSIDHQYICTQLVRANL